jgi:DNA-binding LytR/AlgR family response regulator
LERFIQAVDKAKSRTGKQEANSKAVSPVSAKDLYIRSEGKIHKIDLDDLHYAEAQGNNIKVVTGQGTVMTTMTFSALEDQLPGASFVRVHRSFIINKSKVRVIEGNRVFVGAIEIPIGSSYRDHFLRSIGLKG